ncbi:MAG: hypothetical protein AAGM67_10310, partial [Bacteroidota bacterium]
WDHDGHLYLERSLGKRKPYRMITEWTHSEIRSYTDTLPPHAKGGVSYRWRWVSGTGSALPGPALTLHGPPEHQRSIFSSVRAEGSRLEINLRKHEAGTLTLVDMTGRVLRIKQIDPHTEQTSIMLQSDWVGYLALTWTDYHHVEGKKITIPHR